MTVNEYLRYIQDVNNGYVQNKEVGFFKLEALYKPTDLMIVNKLKSKKITKKQFLSEKQNYENLLYFDLRIGLKSKEQIDLINVNVNSYKELTERIDYLSYAFENDIKLVDGKHILKPVLFHYERNFGLVPFKVFVLAFENLNTNNEKTLRINCKSLNLEEVNFKFDQIVFGNKPKINII